MPKKTEEVDITWEATKYKHNEMYISSSSELVDSTDQVVCNVGHLNYEQIVSTIALLTSYLVTEYE